MSYNFLKTVDYSFEQVIDNITEELKKEGFGILTEIDVKESFKKKLDEDFRKYKILGACNPQFAFEAIQLEPNIGAMLPCNVIVQELENGKVEVTAVDTVSSMIAVKNDSLSTIAKQVREKLRKVIANLN